MAYHAHTNSTEPPVVPIMQPGEPDTAHKLRALEAQLCELESLMVAYSGGVDSAFLAATAHRILGEKMLAVLADSPSLAAAIWSRPSLRTFARHAAPHRQHGRVRSS